jgi:hypothetical protein
VLVLCLHVTVPLLTVAQRAASTPPCALIQYSVGACTVLACQQAAEQAAKQAAARAAAAKEVQLIQTIIFEEELNKQEEVINTLSERALVAEDMVRRNKVRSCSALVLAQLNLSLHL